MFGAPIGTGIKAPRVYYKVGNGAYNFVNAFEIVDDIYRFRIPGQPAGSQISYYIAAQDTSGNYFTSLPAGATGVNPPGIIHRRRFTDTLYCQTILLRQTIKDQYWIINTHAILSMYLFREMYRT